MYEENFSAGFITMLTSPTQITDLSQSCHCRLHPFCSCQTPSQMACDASWALGLKAIYMFTTQPSSWCWHSNYTSVGLPSSFTLPWLYWVWRSCKPMFPVTVATFIFYYGFCKSTIRYPNGFSALVCPPQPRVTSPAPLLVRIVSWRPKSASIKQNVTTKDNCTVWDQQLTVTTVTLHMLHLVFLQGRFNSILLSGSKCAFTTLVQVKLKYSTTTKRNECDLAGWPVPAAAAAAECLSNTVAVNHARPRLSVFPLCNMFIYVSLPL